MLIKNQKAIQVYQGLLQLQACVSAKWSPEGLYDKTVSWITNTGEILKLVKKKIK